MGVGLKKWSVKSSKRKKLEKEAEEWAKHVTSSVKIDAEPLSPIGNIPTIDSYPSSPSADDGTLEVESKDENTTNKTSKAPGDDVIPKQNSNQNRLPPRSPHHIQGQIMNVNPNMCPPPLTYSGSADSSSVDMSTNGLQKKIVRFVNSRDCDEDGVEVHEIQNPSQTTWEMHAHNYHRQPDSYHGGHNNFDEYARRPMLSPSSNHHGTRLGNMMTMPVMGGRCRSMDDQLERNSSMVNQSLSPMRGNVYSGALNVLGEVESEVQPQRALPMLGIFSPKTSSNNSDTKRVTPGSRVATSIRTQLMNCFHPTSQAYSPPSSIVVPNIEGERDFQFDDQIAVNDLNGLRRARSAGMAVSSNASVENGYWDDRHHGNLYLSKSDGGVRLGMNHHYQVQSNVEIPGANAVVNNMSNSQWPRQNNVSGELPVKGHMARSTRTSSVPTTSRNMLRHSSSHSISHGN
mmetsp:Transcript_8183/g.17789  ORF Transcript_8183/g.17789 Transcript_8183/m.17789 type:complete len:459 (-) Transcript_8183:171-1547(-)